MKRILLFLLFCSSALYTVSADDFTDLLQDLAIQTACLGMYSSAEAGVNTSFRYDDPPDWYTPPMMANRFAEMSGNMTRIETFYGVCFDYAEFAWRDIQKYQKTYNDAGMRDTQWYIAVADKGNPNVIILYDPAAPEDYDIIGNGVYLKEHSRRRVYSHDGAEEHAWLWVQHKNGTWYWIDPTWTDNTGYVWWGVVNNEREVQYYPDPVFCVAENYPRAGEAIAETQRSRSTYAEEPSPSRSARTENKRPNTSTSENNDYGDYNEFWIGYHYCFEMPIGFTIGYGKLYLSFNIDMSAYYDTVTSGSPSYEGLTGETKTNGLEFVVGYSFEVIDGVLRLPIGIGMSLTDEYQRYRDSAGNIGWYGESNFENRRAIAEAGLQLILFHFLYVSSTYRFNDLSDFSKVKDFSKNRFTFGAGLVF